MYDEMHTACAIIGVMTAIFSVSLNTTLIVAFSKMSTKVRSKTSNILLVNQSCADLLTIVPSLIHSLSVYYWIAEQTYQRSLSVITYVISFFTGPAVLATLILTIVHGSYIINFSGKYSNVFSGCKVVAAIVGMWILSCVPAIVVKVFVVDSSDRPQSEYNFLVGYFIVVIVVVVLLVVVLVFSCRTHRSLNCVRLLKPSTTSPYEEMEVATGHQTQRHLITSLFLRIITVVATHVPHIVLSLILLHGDEMNEFLYHVANWLSMSYVIYTLHPILNSLITIFLVDDFQEARRWITFGKFATVSTIDEESEMKMSIQLNSAYCDRPTQNIYTVL